ncbi:acyltransferase family protein [Reinekea marinisedimentorum]|uniref:Surface polysaccharide O-acyltransferase-like enzyme n=1 Tax=Reinekea marinisedimentorum TaxID=230495 RepID=A0A4R3IC67_9GAMM|nr:acyltransferase family protein [Reinekea marinisedimentorum]TCS44111.1 surface polysaccharide O-acyltransferase-like enzyme [Reinekea marinisedimentorum]
MRLYYLDQVRAIAIVMVVMIHAISYTNGISEALFTVVQQLTLSVAVPIFFLVDGYLFCLGKSPDQRTERSFKLKANFKRLVIPWISFTVIYTFCRYIFEVLGVVEANVINVAGLYELFMKMLGGVYSSQLYFLLSLFIVRLAVTSIERLYNFSSGLLLLFAVSLAIAYSVFNTELSVIRLTPFGIDALQNSLWGVSFFMLGMFLGLATFEIKRLMPVVTAVFLCSAYGVYQWNTDFIGLMFQYSYMLFLFIGFMHIPKINWLASLGKNTMGIYLLHSPVLLKLLAVVFGALGLKGISGFAALSLLTLATSWIAAGILVRLPQGKAILGSR